ncbi:putative 2-oxoglutarate-dependent dioxygenase SLC1 [Curcuma longa]|uniref:putative 2-oxoglutarate-dependent dioxygenase SLC1 n=1 Tax=Curcuma longa TaxID=136217 RepID=UPI003D9E1232
MEKMTQGERGVEEAMEVDDSIAMKGVRHLCENVGITRVPSKYIFPFPDRPQITSSEQKPKLKLPVIDIGELLSADRTRVLETLDRACKEYGFFQVVNHGIDNEVIQRMINAGKQFFELPFEERSKYSTTNTSSPVRYGTSFSEIKDKVFCWRDFLKLTCHSLDTILPLWPSAPINFRDDAILYSKKIRTLFLVLIAAVLEALGVGDGSGGSSMKEFEEGSHLLVLNCYPACPEPELTLGMPSHSDYGFLTLVLQDEVEGLQMLHAGDWITIDPVPGSFVVNVGDHLEIHSNGRYKSVLHRVLVNASELRMSVASLHSVAFDSLVSPAAGLVDDGDKRRLYKDTGFADFLAYLSTSVPKSKSFLESRKLTT